MLETKPQIHVKQSHRTTGSIESNRTVKAEYPCVQVCLMPFINLWHIYFSSLSSVGCFYSIRLDYLINWFPVQIICFHSRIFELLFATCSFSRRCNVFLAISLMLFPHSTNAFSMLLVVAVFVSYRFSVCLLLHFLVVFAFTPKRFLR